MTSFWQFPQLALLLLQVHRHLRTQGLAATLARFPGIDEGRSDLVAAQRAARGLRRLRLLLPRARCLDQAIVLRYWLGRSGTHALLKIGAQRGAHGFAAHAWVEVAGIPVLEAASVNRDFASFPGSTL